MPASLASAQKIQPRMKLADLAAWIEQLTIPSPKEMYTALEHRGYRGQHKARQALCLMAYRHLKRLKHIYVDRYDPDRLPPKSNLLLMGPTGCGKTHLVELLFSELLGLPTVIVDVTVLSETGYVGQDPNTVLTRLLNRSEGHAVLAQVGIVCLDEFDKLASSKNTATFSGQGTTKDVTGLGVQRELLKMLEASEVSLPQDMGHSTYAPQTVLSTRDIAFIAAGAFSGFKQLALQKGQSVERMGFNRELICREQEQIDSAPSQGEVEDVSNLQSYGFLPELIGRFSRVVSFDALDAGTLEAIARDNYLPRHVHEFALEGYELTVHPSYVDHVVQQALKRRIGARGISATISRTLEQIAFDSFQCDAAGGRIQVRIEQEQVVVDCA